MEPTNIKPVTEAELARVLELDAKRKAAKTFDQICAASDAFHRVAGDLCPRLARELAAARAAIKAVLETNGGPIDGADTTDGKAYVMVEMSAFQALAQLNTHTHE